jgi:phosphate transport system permease protein
MSMLPTVTIVLIERMAAIPQRYIIAATGLGLNEEQVVWAVLLRQSWGGLISGCLLGLARAAGETAPIMFTATIFAGATLPRAVVESPVLTLPYHIFILAQDSFAPGVGTKLWGAALVLLGLVFSMSLAALPSRLRLHEESHV